MAEHEHEAPPVGEEIHFPQPSILPFLNAIGVTLMILGVTLGWVISVLGGLLFLATAVRWIRDVRRDMAELPAEHR